MGFSELFWTCWEVKDIQSTIELVSLKFRKEDLAPPLYPHGPVLTSIILFTMFHLNDLFMYLLDFWPNWKELCPFFFFFFHCSLWYLAHSNCPKWMFFSSSMFLCCFRKRFQNRHSESWHIIKRVSLAFWILAPCLAYLNQALCGQWGKPSPKGKLE